MNDSSEYTIELMLTVRAANQGAAERMAQKALAKVAAALPDHILQGAIVSRVEKDAS